MAVVFNSSSFPFTCNSTVIFSRLQAASPTTSCLGIRPRFPHRRWLNSYFGPSRLGHVNTKCSITSTDVYDQITNKEFDEDIVNANPTCAAPVIHIRSDEMESEAFNLLVQSAYIDTLLTKLPVLSEEEQNMIYASPAHPAGLYALYANCLTGNLVEQLWNFAWPVSIALVHPSLLPVALMGFVTKMVIIVGGPLVGKLMDQFPRVSSYNCLTIVQAAAQLLSVAMIIEAHTLHPISVSSVLLQPWFFVLLIAGAVERLCGLALGVAMERDWVVLLAGTNRPIALAQANAIISRIDLLCEIAGASLFGILLSKYQPMACLKFAAGLMIATLPVSVFLTLLTNKLSAGVLERNKVAPPHVYTTGFGCDSNVQNLVEKSWQTIKHGWIEYIQQPVLPASIAYVLLNFNVVLAPGGLMTAFLTQSGLNPSIIGGFNGLCAFMGVAATFVSARLVKHVGILKAGAIGLVLKASLLSVAVAFYWTGPLSQQRNLLLFLSLIVLSRLGYMSYDMVGQQILQTGIPESKANLIGTTEVSVASLAESVMLGVAIIANEVSHFGFLAMLSLLSVVAAAWLFCRWLMNPTDRQRSLFAFDPFF